MAEISDEHLIPIRAGNAVRRGWTAATGGEPAGVTWHWTATRDLAHATRLLGGANAERRGEASAHYGVGRSEAEGTHRYVRLENRSWHAGVGQTLRWDGKPCRLIGDKGYRTTIGVEAVNVGFERPGVRAYSDWISCVSANGKHHMRVAPWPDEQVQMLVGVGKEIVDRFPHIRPEDHHGHHDLCPGYKPDVCGFPFARLLREIYGDETIADVWSPYWTIPPRQQALIDLGYDLGSWGADGDWGRLSDAALQRFQRDHGMVIDGMWTTFVCRAVNEALLPA